jgi:hypothetical protein
MSYFYELKEKTRTFGAPNGILWDIKLALSSNKKQSRYRPVVAQRIPGS